MSEEEVETPDEEMEETGQEEEEPPSDKEEDVLALEQAKFSMEATLGEFELNQTKEEAEQQDILESVRLEVEVASNRRFIHQGDMVRE